MIDALAFGSVAIGVLGVLLLVLLAVRRIVLARHERRYREAEVRLRPLALALVADGTKPHALSALDAVVFAELLGRYARRLRGSSAERIGRFFERNGSIEQEVAALGDRRTWRRATAAYSLGDMSSRAAIPGLLAALGDPKRDVRAAAARSLGRLGAVEAVPALVEALAARRVPPAVAGFALVQIGPEAVPGLEPLLGEVDAGVRASATELVGLVGGAADGAALRRGLRDSSAEVRARSARALGRLGAEEAAAELRAALDDRVPFVRTAAAHALGAIRDREAFERLLEQARTDAFDPAHAAAGALAAIDQRRLAAVAAASGAGAHVLEASDLAAL